MPPETVEAFLDHGSVADRPTGGTEDARRTLERFADAGIDYDDVVAVLEREGVEKFSTSFQKLFDTISDKRERLLTV